MSERLSTAYERLYEYLCMSIMGEDALALAVELAYEAACEMRRKRSRAGRDAVEAKLRRLGHEVF